MKEQKFILLWHLFLAFLSISPITFGGGYAMIPLLEKKVVEHKKWVKKEEISDVLVLAQMAPGSIAVNTATFIGYRIAGFAGALVSTIAIVLPTFMIVLILAAFFINFQHHPIIQAAFMGIRPSIVALIIYAAVLIAKSALYDNFTKLIAIISVIIFLFLPIHPIFVLLGGALIGIGWNTKLIRKYHLEEKRQT